LLAAYVGQAQILQTQERWDEAQTVYEEAAAALPNSARLMGAYAGYLLDRGDETQALALLEEARGKVHEVPTLVTIASLYYELGETALSESLLQSALEMEPGSLVVLIGLGDLYEGEGRTEEARILYEQIVALNPGLPLGYLRLGNLANTAGDQETADEYAALAQQVAPGYFGP
jgi:tetratricopeptide (TPR) repeat protein